MDTETPRVRAERRVERTGGEVRLGVWMRMRSSAVERSFRIVALRGVRGVETESVEAKGWKEGFRRWGEGRKMVGIGLAIEEKRLMRCVCPRS